ncbi:hypothetical protein LNTAR_19347 [Lentisphaera araneosa HTCC2155]|uniref:Uncharacterized protein n=1 Tax=Lentisphaera araneosa HTCC2155 TaxID=313628 RepID=A6DQT5_9BACT|nr:hypothetical protein [Lentisphaera araneosa]EDM25985.1 hypothetical protein LNTAR_19347 [Lentisphaera araneosa HTCC2155]
MRSTTLLIIFISLLGFASDKQVIRCIACKEICSQTIDIKDDISKPSKNITIWNRSMCPNFHSYGFICPKDFYAYSSYEKQWNLSTVNKDAFTIKLNSSIYNVPIPKQTINLVVYDQTITKKKKNESLCFWIKIDETYIQEIKKYCQQNDLTLKIHNEKNNTCYIEIIKKTIANKRSE